jgi:hypothetical protein
VHAQYACVHSALLHLAFDVAHELPPLLWQAQAPGRVGGVSSACVVPVAVSWHEHNSSRHMFAGGALRPWRYAKLVNSPFAPIPGLAPGAAALLHASKQQWALCLT